MKAQPALRSYTDFAAWESDWRGLVVNERLIVQHVAEPTSLLTLKPDHELIRLFQAHDQIHTPIDGGDIVVAHRLAVHGSSASAKAITQYCWSTPVVLYPDARTAAARCATVAAPSACSRRLLVQMRTASRPWVVAATVTEGLTAHLVLVAAMFSVSRKGACN